MAALLSLHIVLMTLSLIGTAGMAAASLSSVKIGTSFMRANIAVTTAGTLSGMALLLVEPIGVKCLMLASYVVVFALTYRFASRRNQLLAVSSAS